jgi:hypothetical protein
LILVGGLGYRSGLADIGVDGKGMLPPESRRTSKRLDANSIGVRATAAASGTSRRINMF